MYVFSLIKRMAAGVLSVVDFLSPCALLLAEFSPHTALVIQHRGREAGMKRKPRAHPSHYTGVILLVLPEVAVFSPKSACVSEPVV